MSTVIKTLLEFVDSAVRNRKYPYGTAVGRRAALKLFEPELNDEERESLDTFKAHLDQIYRSVYNKNKSKMTAESWVTYKNRLKALISDYEKYGVDPTKMANWNRTIRKETVKGKIKAEDKSDSPTQETERYKEVDMSRFELPLRSGVKAIILVPSDINKEEVGKIRKYIDFLENISETKIKKKEEHVNKN